MATKSSNSSKGILGVIGVFILSKLKWVLAILKLGKFATLASMFVSLGAYALFYGWKFAVAIIYLMFVHEMGHLVAAKMKDIPTKPAVFIPFLGAAIGINPKKIKNAETEFFIAYGGPLAGLISILPAIALYSTTHDPFWMLVVHLGALINLFNLFPVSPLDGGRIVSVLSTKIWFVGLLVIIPFLFISPDPILFLIFFFGIITWMERLRESTKIAVLQQEVKVSDEMNEKIRSITDARFFVLSPSDVILLMNELNARKDQLHNYFARHLQTNSLNPFSKQRVEKKQVQTELDLIGKFIYALNQKMKMFYVNEGQPVCLEDIVEQNDKLRNEKKQELKRIKTYYQSSIGTKIKALVLYLGLALILALLLVYAINTMDAAQLTGF